MTALESPSTPRRASFKASSLALRRARTLLCARSRARFLPECIAHLPEGPAFAPHGLPVLVSPLHDGTLLLLKHCSRADYSPHQPFVTVHPGIHEISGLLTSEISWGFPEPSTELRQGAL